MSNKTRFMTVLFSATDKGDDSLTKQVADEVQSAKKNGSYEDEDGEMSYQDLGEKGVLARDKETGEYTLIHNNPIQVGDDVLIDLEEVPEYCVGELIHPEVSVNKGSMITNPMAEKEFSVTTSNSAVLRIFSEQDLVEVVSESVSRSDQEAQVGDLKFEKDPTDDSIIVTDITSGDKAKVELNEGDMNVTELDQKNFKSFSNKGNMKVNAIRRKVFSHDEQYEPIFVVGIDPINKVLVNSPVYGEEAANDLAQKLAERGISGVAVFANPDEGRDYAMGLLCGEGATEVSEKEEEVEVAYSDHSVIVNRYFSDRTRFMSRLFSEAEENVADHQEIIESAINDGDQLETEDFIITPVDETTAIVEDKDNGEYTIAELDKEEINVDQIDESKAKDMMKNLEVSEDSKEKEFSNVRKVNGSIGQKSYAANALIETGKKNQHTASNAVKRAAALIKKNPKAAIATGLGLATAAGAGLAAKKMKQKDNSDSEDTLAQIEDSSVEAIQNVQDAAETAIEAINQAKETPVEEVSDVKEATYSQKSYSEADIYNPSLNEIKW